MHHSSSLFPFKLPRGCSSVCNQFLFFVFLSNMYNYILSTGQYWNLIWVLLWHAQFWEFLEKGKSICDGTRLSADYVSRWLIVNQVPCVTTNCELIDNVLIFSFWYLWPSPMLSNTLLALTNLSAPIKVGEWVGRYFFYVGYSSCMFLCRWGWATDKGMWWVLWLSVGVCLQGANSWPPRAIF